MKVAQKLTEAQAVEFYRQMLMIRLFENACARLYMQGKIKGFLHLYIGEEAIAIGSISVLNQDDYVISHYRDHGHALAKGMDPGVVMAELCGKATGSSAGKGGSMHLFDASKCFMGGHAIVGGLLPIAVGLGLAIKLQGESRVVLCFFGDGAVNQGEFHESLNLASLWRLPVVFFLENNLYGMGSHVDTTHAGGRDIYVTADPYRIPAVQIDGMDLMAVRDATTEALTRVRSDGGPVFIEAMTYRFRGHSMADPSIYRDQGEVEEWRARSPSWIRGTRTSTPEVRFPLPETIIREAIAQGLREALRSDDSVFIMGEDIGAYGGGYAVTRGFLDEFGPKRVRDTPIAESVIVGSAVGAALGGLRPVVEIMTINFALLAMDQIVNHAAKLHYMSNGQFTVPIVIRTVTGGGGQLGATHSQSLEGWFASVPGLKVVAPSTPHDALGLLRTAVKDENPVVYAEHALLYTARGEVPEGWYEIPFGQAVVRRPGADVTIIAYSRMAHVAMQAASILASTKGREAEVIDLRSLRPLDYGTIIESVKKTNRAVVVEEAWRTGSFSGEIASAIQEAAFDYLDGPVARVGGDDVPMPYAGPLETEAIPSAKRVLEAIETTFGI